MTVSSLTPTNEMPLTAAQKSYPEVLHQVLRLRQKSSTKFTLLVRFSPEKRLGGLSKIDIHSGSQDIPAILHRLVQLSS